LGLDLDKQYDPNLSREENADVFNTYFLDIADDLGYTIIADAAPSARQNTVYMPTCGGSGFLRLRQYLSGPRKDLVTLGIKSHGSRNFNDGKDDVTDFTPADNVADYGVEAFTKELENDLLECQNDYAANTRLYFKETPAVATCEEANQLWPHAFEHTDGRALEVNRIDYVWQYKLDGIFDNGIRFYTTTDIYYDSIDDAINGNNPSSGHEWSVTVVGNKSTKKYDQALASVRLGLDKMVTEFGDYSPDSTCSNPQFEYYGVSSPPPPASDSQATVITVSFWLLSAALVSSAYFVFTV
jgi:hypothetical protein